MTKSEIKKTKVETIDSAAGDTTAATPPAAAAPGTPAAPAKSAPKATGHTNPLAIASFVLSLSGLSILGQIAGIITGHMALKQIKATGDPGHGLAKWGLIISYVVVGLAVLGLVFFIALWAIMLVTLGATFSQFSDMGDFSQYGMMDYESF